MRSDVIRAPSRLDRSGKFLPIVQGESQISRRMALAAMPHGLGAVRAAIPYGVALDIGLIALVGIEHRRPKAPQTSLINRKQQPVLRPPSPHPPQAQQHSLD